MSQIIYDIRLRELIEPELLCHAAKMSQPVSIGSQTDAIKLTQRLVQEAV